jgi:ParB-like chromosome segregation protein Spo0J
MRSILIELSQRYPLRSIEDLYKLIHQSATGSEYALSDVTRVRGWLRTELAQLEPGPDEPLLNPISPNAKVVRIHLRPFTELNLDKEKLLQAFILSAQKTPPSAIQLLKYAALATKLAEDGPLHFGADDVSGYIQEFGASGFPADHHSIRFEEEYKLACPVVA